LEVWIKRLHGSDLSVSVGDFFLNISFNPSKGSHEREAGSDSRYKDGDEMVTGGFQPLILKLWIQESRPATIHTAVGADRMTRYGTSQGGVFKS
jgi:hypothetical protein